MKYLIAVLLLVACHQENAALHKCESYCDASGGMVDEITVCKVRCEYDAAAAEFTPCAAKCMEPIKANPDYDLLLGKKK